MIVVIVKDDLQTYWNWMEEFGEEVGGMGGRIMGWYRGPNPVITTTCPEILKEVFIKDAENFVDRPLLDRSDNIPHLINMRHTLSLVQSIQKNIIPFVYFATYEVHSNMTFLKFQCAGYKHILIFI